ncbi:CHAT domain-containing tetratricopeptide repeat protein [Paraliomyxa miuraensis]|nr:CHAT domain-containing tetratricopeptide repeat protein [Paraliomyxa miuraensis]
MLLLAIALAPVALAVPAPAHAVVEPTKDELDAALVSATKALEAYKAGDYETAATEGRKALPVIGPLLGWDSDPVRLLGGVTVDALEKLGRNAEADEVRRLDDHVESTKPPTVATSPDPSSAQPSPPKPPATPRERAGQHAANAMLAFIDGRYEPATVEAEAAIAVLEAEAPATPELSGYRTLLAGLYQVRLQYDQAEVLLQRNLDEAEAAGDDAPLSSALDALAGLRRTRGELDEAEVLYRRMLEVSARLGTPQSRASALQGLASVDVARGRPEAAIGRLEEAVGLQESRMEPGTMHLLSPVSALGNAYEEAGRFERAEPTLQRALGIAERAFGRSSPVEWNVRSELGRLYRSMKRYDEAIAIFEEILREQETKLAPRSASIGATLNHLAETLWAKGGSPARTIDLASRAAELQEHDIIEVIAAGSEQQKRAYLERYVSGTDRIITYHVRHVPTDDDAARLSINTILRRKGRVLDAVSGHQQAVRERLAEGDRAAFDRLREVRGQISSLVLRGPDDNLGPDEHRAKLAALEQEVVALEKQLASVDEVALDAELIELSAVQAALPEDAVLVEIAAYRPFDVHYESFATAFGPPSYVAYVIHREGSPVMVDLGPAAAIDEAVTALRRALANPRSSVGSLARRLDALTMEKIRPHLRGHEQVFVSPDGQLNLVPLSALVDERDRYLVETLEITYLSSGRDLMRLQAASAFASSLPVLVGAPDFSASGGSATPEPGPARRSADMSDQMFRPLPGTQAEVDAIAELVDGASIHTGADATERVLQEVSSPVLLHVATHGFFLADQASTVDGARGVVYQKKADDGWRPPPKGENPLIRSGLALSGANLRAAPEGGDGLLTALELASLDLSGTELVVLSACETGVGEVRNGEGVYGLRRALVIAGARSQVMSLWQVDDEATRALMVGYYRQLRRGKGRSAALRKVQRKLLRDKETRHPFYWAAFIPSGDWQPMSLKVETPRQRRPRRTGGGSERPERFDGDLRDYWSERFDDPLTYFHGSYDAPIEAQQHEGFPATSTRSFGLRMRVFTRPHVFFGLDYGRQPWDAQASPRQTELAFNRFEVVLGLDLLALPYEWRVRPGLHPYLGAGLGWGVLKQLGEGAVAGDERERELMGALGITLGTEGALYFRLGDRLGLALLGGVAKPIYRMRAGGERLPFDDEFPRAWRWQAGIGIGGLPR